MKLFLMCVGFLLIAAMLAASETPAKLTSLAASALYRTTPDGAANYWLLLDSTAIGAEPIPLTPRALKRRDRVDPVRHLIDLRDYGMAPSVLRQITQTGASIRRVSRWLKAISVEANPAQMAQLTQIPAVRQIDLVRRLVASPEPELLQSLKPVVPQADLSAPQNSFIKATKLHRYGLTGKGVLIALLDSGFDTDHHAFDSATVVATYDFIHNVAAVDGPECLDDASYQQDLHGTIVFGVIGGFMPDTLVGVAYKADYALAKTEITCYGTEIKIEEDNWVAAAEWADSLGADILSSSLGYNQFDDSGSYTADQLDGNTALITIAADIAASKNILVVVAAGNERQKAWGRITFPADGDSVLAVGALTPDTQVVSFSSPGPSADGRIKPDISTLGVGVVGVRARGTYTYQQGTSLATPLVAGGAALALELFPDLTAEELRNLIRTNGHHASNPDNNFGYGAYDAARSADLIRIDRQEEVIVRVGEHESLDITTSGRIGETPILSVIDPPLGVSFLNNGDGTGRLEIEGRGEQLGSISVRITASVTDFVDTTVFTISTYPELAEPVLAAPNPFADSVKIVSANDNAIISISVFTTAGEKVWEWHKGTAESADIVQWDGRNAHGQKVAPGVYFVRVQTSRGNEIVKILKTG